MRTSSRFCVNGLLLILLFLNQGWLFAQKNKVVLQSNYATQPVLIDGLSTDWAADLFHENKASKLVYAVSNNDSTLFLVVKGTAPQDLQRLLLGGIDFSMNFSGEKNDLQTITFPLMPRNVRTSASKPTSNTAQELANLKEIGVSGFEQLLDGKISVKNDYGIRAAAGIDETGLLVFEYALPMKLLHSDALKSDIFVCQIKVNGLNINPSNRFIAQNFNRGINAGRPMQQQIPATSFLEGTEFRFYCRLATNEK